MATKIVTKNSSTAGAAPTATDLVQGELAVNVADKRLFTEDNGGSIVELGTNPYNFTANHNGSAKLATTSTGIDVTGTMTADGVQVGNTSDAYSAVFITTSTTGESELRMGDTDTDAGSIAYTNSDDTMTFRAAAGARMTLDSTGIDVTGTATMDGLTVDGGASINGNIEVNSATVSIVLNETDRTDENTQLLNASGNFRIRTRSDDGNTNAERLRIDHGTGDISFYEDTGTTPKLFWDASAERLGLGTSSPATALDARGGVNSAHATFTGQASRGLVISTANTLSNDDAVVYNAQTASSGKHIFQTGATERMRIDSAGAVIVNNGGAGNGIIKINGATGNTEAVIFQRGGTEASRIGHANSADLAFYTGSGATERMRIDSSGNVLVGKTSLEYTSEGSVFRERGEAYITSDGRAPLLVNRLTSDGDVVTIKKDGTTVGSIGVEAGLYPYIGGNAGNSGDVFLIFISNSSQSIRPATATGAGRDNAIDLGASSARFDDIYATNGTIQTSDRNEKQDIAELSDAEQRVAVACKGLLRKFRWKDSVAEKGDEARIHFGIIAQDLQAAFAAEGLDAGDYAMFISTTWTDEETNEEKTRLGVRYSELLAFIISAL